MALGRPVSIPQILRRGSPVVIREYVGPLQLAVGIFVGLGSYGGASQTRLIRRWHDP